MDVYPEICYNTSVKAIFGALRRCFVIMPELTYVQQRDRRNLAQIRELLVNLPSSCTFFIQSIEETTTTLTRLAYARDLQLFFRFLIAEVSEFGDQTAALLTDADVGRVTGAHVALYAQFLSLYVNDQERELVNHELAKMRKLASLRSYFQFMFKSGRIAANVAQLIDLPKIHEKPILRLEIDEAARLLDAAQTGEALSSRQKAWHEHTKARDLAILSLFLGTGIRVSECVGLNLEDVDFSLNSFLVTRKGGAQVILYFPDEVARALKDYLTLRRDMKPLPGHEHALFLSLQNKRMGVRSVENMVKKYARIAAPLKKRISPHKLRSTFGTNLYHETGDIYLVADVLGHSDVNTTRKHYAAMSDDRRRLAAAHVKLRDNDASYTDAEPSSGDEA